LGPISIAAMLGGERLLRPLSLKALRAVRLLPPPAEASPA
jgi:hypothetical protein